MNKLISYIIAIIIVIFIYFVTSLYMRNKTNSNWFNCIKSNYTPPSWVFGVVWTILYIFLIIILAKIIRLPSKTKYKYILLLLFILNLGLGTIWSYIYFNKQNVYLANIIMSIILLLTIIVYVFLIYIIPFYGYLYLFYTIWIIFATFLSLTSKINNQC